MFSGLRTSSIWLPFDEVLRPLNRSEEHTSELQSHSDLVCRLLLEKKKKVPALRSEIPHHACSADKTCQGSYKNLEHESASQLLTPAATTTSSRCRDAARSESVASR